MNLKLVLAAVLLIGTLHISEVASLALADTCYVDADCNTVATAVTNSYCMRMYSDCAYGVCACSSGYAVVGTACLATQTVGGACTDNSECVKNIVATTVTCDTNVCTCSTGTYSSIYKICLDTNKKALGQTGCNSGDCGTITNAVCSTSTACACDTGYITDSAAQTCTKPYVGQACAASPGCQKRSLLSGDTSETVPDCTNSVCACASGSSQVTVNAMSVCVTTVTTGFNQGVACTDINDCSSNLCVQCAGADAKYCVAAASGAVSVLKHATGVLLATLLLVSSNAI